MFVSYKKAQSFLHTHYPVDCDDIQARRRGQEGAGAPPAFQLGEQGGAKVPFLNEMIYFLIVNMIKRRSYKLKASNI